MSGWLWLLLAVAAVIGLWVVGAYNRLVALRNRIGQAWGEIDRSLQRRREAGVPLLEALRTPLAAEPGALAAFGSAALEAERAAQRMATAPTAVTHATAWVRAESALSAAAARLLALAAQQPAWQDSPDLPALARGWQQADDATAAARTLFDHGAAAYNAALAQAPTRWLRRVFGFDAAGLLGR
jgi:LemA protein